VAARPVEDAAGGRRPAACMLLLHALTHAPHRAVSLSFSLRFWRLLPWQAAAFDKVHSRVRHFGGLFTLPYKKTWATRCIALRSMSRGLDGSRRPSLTDDYQSELRDQAQLRRSARTTTALAAG
jgi:hypothetical protein